LEFESLTIKAFVDDHTWRRRKEVLEEFRSTTRVLAGFRGAPNDEGGMEARRENMVSL